MRPTGALALGGERAVWTEDYGGSSIDASAYTAALNDRRVRAIFDIEGVPGLGGIFADFAGDGDTLAFAWADIDFETEDEHRACYSGRGCRFIVVGGGARRVVAGRAVRIPGAPPAFRVAASAGRIAVVPADRTKSAASYPRPVAGGPVEIRNAEDGTIVSTFAPAGTVRAVALTGRNAAVLVVDASRQKRIARYDSVTGSLLGPTPVPPATAAALEVAGENVVSRVGRSIWLLRSGVGTLARLWTARRTPVAVSIEGRRIVWAVNGKRRGRVLTLLLPSG